MFSTSSPIGQVSLSLVIIVPLILCACALAWLVIRRKKGLSSRNPDHQGDQVEKVGVHSIKEAWSEIEKVSRLPQSKNTENPVATLPPDFHPTKGRDAGAPVSQQMHRWADKVGDIKVGSMKTPSEDGPGIFELSEPNPLFFKSHPSQTDNVGNDKSAERSTGGSHDRNDPVLSSEPPSYPGSPRPQGEISPMFVNPLQLARTPSLSPSLNSSKASTPLHSIGRRTWVRKWSERKRAYFYHVPGTDLSSWSHPPLQDTVLLEEEVAAPGESVSPRFIKKWSKAKQAPYYVNTDTLLSVWVLPPGGILTEDSRD